MKHLFALLALSLLAVATLALPAKTEAYYYYSRSRPVFFTPPQSPPVQWPPSCHGSRFCR